jgi:hypothetical protein
MIEPGTKAGGAPFDEPESKAKYMLSERRGHIFPELMNRDAGKMAR